tara:strand:- start:6403 stop:7656 length:1254 start_codon:yes stop_codon:yes gene_type:complete
MITRARFIKENLILLLIKFNMEHMKKTFLIPFLAVFTLLLIGLTSAANLATGVDTEFNGVELGSNTMVGMVRDTVPVRITFDAVQDMSEVRVTIRMEGHRDDIEAETSRFDIEDGSTYTKLLSLDLPSDLKDDLSKEFTLYVEISSASDRTEEEYTISIQRESYDLDVLSVDVDTQISAGDIVPVVIVIKNIGYNDGDDNYVVASIPALGISSRGYAGDLVPMEDCEDDCDDSVQKVVYLQIPSNAVAGAYELEVEVYNDDTETVVRKLVNIGGSTDSLVLAAVKTQDIKAGETKTYDLILVNSADNVKVFNIATVSGTALTVSAPSVVTVGPDASETVEVTVTAASHADIGAYTFSVDVNGEQIVFGANVTEESVSASVVALTVILVIIFVVLLAVLIVLLTRKEQPIEEAETSYY